MSLLDVFAKRFTSSFFKNKAVETVHLVWEKFIAIVKAIIKLAANILGIVITSIIKGIAKVIAGTLKVVSICVSPVIKFVRAQRDKAKKLRDETRERERTGKEQATKLRKWIEQDKPQIKPGISNGDLLAAMERDNEKAQKDAEILDRLFQDYNEEANVYEGLKNSGIDNAMYAENDGKIIVDTLKLMHDTAHDHLVTEEHGTEGIKKFEIDEILD